jgi:hypothetical protein
MTDSRHLTSAEVASLGLTNLEYRYYGTRDPDVERDDETCDMWSVVVCADGHTEEFPHCDNSVAEDSGGPLEGIGGAYTGKHGGTFTYIEDDHGLCERYIALVERAKTEI